jgi:hypothetical protein
MITKFSEAHERMLSNPDLQVRTHRWREVRLPPAKGRKRRNNRGARPVIIGGVSYPSMKQARKDLRIGVSKFYSMLDTGKARYA